VCIEFSTVLAQIWRECPYIIWLKNRVGDFGFSRSFLSYKQMKEQEGYFFEPLSLTGRKKQTRQAIKIRRHGF